MLPASKAVPKEMITLVDKPVIQYLVEEAVSAGIEEIVIVLSRGKGKLKELESVRSVSLGVKIAYVRQPEAT